MRVLGATLVFLAGLMVMAAPASASDDVFVVQRVQVQGQAGSASEAKTIAQITGRRRAMDILLRRLTVEDDWVYLPTLAAGRAAPVGGGVGGKSAILLNDSALERLEQSFEVYTEKSAPTTYRAFITYRFKPDAMRRLLKDARIPYSETQTRTALVLPVLQTDNGVYLWESNNPWLAAWKARPYTNELTPMRAPLGDLEDSRLISASQALNVDTSALEAIGRHYAVSQVIVAHARLRQEDGKDNLSVRLINGYRESDTYEGANELDPTMVSAERAGPALPAVDELNFAIGDVIAQTYLSEASGNFPLLAEQAIESVIARYSKGWKERTLIDYASQAVFDTSAFFSSLEDWAKIRAGLVATPLVGSVQVYALSPRGAEMRLRVYGDPSRLAVAMENYGVTFWTETGQRWFLATPRVASSLKGSRLLQRRVEFEGSPDAQNDGFDLEPSLETYEDAGEDFDAIEEKIEQTF